MSENCQLVVFSNKAYNAIIRESFDKDPVETGGILLGHVLDNGVWIVMEVLPPGIKSIFEYAYFEYDETFVNYLAQSVANQYKRPLDLLGLWHRHPGSMDVFSSTDDGTNTTFARQNHAGVISGLVNIDPQFRLTMYHLDSPTHRIMGRPKYDVVEVEVGDDIIPEEYFELRYYDGAESNLHPMVNSKGRERQVNRTLRDEHRTETGHDPVSAQQGASTDGLDIQGIINQGLPPCDNSQNPTPKVVNDFFSFWRASKKKWLYILLAVVALIVGAFTIRSCKENVEKMSSWFNEWTNDNSKRNPELSEDKVELTEVGQSKTLTITNHNGQADWKSSNPDVVTVKDGTITAVSNGNAIIEAYINGNSVGQCEVSVVIVTDTPEEGTGDEDPGNQTAEEGERGKSGQFVTDNTDVINVLIDRSKTYHNGNAGTMKVTDKPFPIPIKKTGTPPPSVSFISSDPEVATVDNNGVVIAKKEGQIEIEILCNGKQTDTFKLTVNK